MRGKAWGVGEEGYEAQETIRRSDLGWNRYVTWMKQRCVISLYRKGKRVLMCQDREQDK